MSSYAEIIVEVASRRVDRPFHYLVPDNLQPLSVGARVLVPFGSRKVPGYVVGYSAPPKNIAVKEVAGVIGGGLPPDLMRLADWMSKKYICTLAESLQCVLGPGREEKRISRRLFAKVNTCQLTALKLTSKQKTVLTNAIENPGLTKADLARISNVSVSTVAALLNKGLLYWDEQPFFNQQLELDQPPVLTPEQQKVVKTVKTALERGGFDAFLLYGVTGSGKTEVYLNSIEAALQKNKQAIVLVPEISLTPQMVSIFHRRFGAKVAVLHSRLSAGERYRERLRIERGDAQVVLGARSAVFAPVRNLGIVIIDEEHEPLYKQEENPKYHAREVALYRGRLAGAVVLMSSATPALESFCRAEPEGPYQLLKMTKRVGDRSLPEVHVVDMRQESGAADGWIFSSVLLQKIKQRLDSQQQVVLFLNRRGYSSFVVCRNCGHVLKCPSCDISLTYHYDGKLRCHYCDHLEHAKKICPECGSKEIGYLGMGTQKVEEEVRRLFPGVRVLRMDGDTTGRKGAHEEILAAFKAGYADVLVGTQMIAKGLDIPNVTLVGVVSADTMLYMPDFRSAERTFQLLTQVAGRAGRGKYPGETVVQTYNPDHYSIKCARHHDYIRFYQQEMKLRRALKYPPFYYMSRILLSGKQADLVEKAANEFRQALLKDAAACELIVLGPAPAALAKIQKRFRWQLVLKGRRAGEVRSATAQAVYLWDEKSALKNKVTVTVDIDPQFLF